VSVNELELRPRQAVV